MDEKLRILLCEDDENLGMLLREYLQAKDYDADLFSDGEAGYKAFLKGKYDLCVLDVMMPDMDGIEVLREIRKKYSTPVVLMTADKTLDTSTEFATYGCDDYITKPFLPLLLKEVIHNMTERTTIEE